MFILLTDVIGQKILVNIDNIISVETYQNGVMIRQVDGKEIIVQATVSDIYTKLHSLNKATSM